MSDLTLDARKIGKWRCPGAAQWAASKPNVLNVALTRAKRRIYIVGDHSFWGQFPYFEHMAKALPSVQPTDFYAAVQENWCIMHEGHQNTKL